MSKKNIISLPDEQEVVAEITQNEISVQDSEKLENIIMIEDIDNLYICGIRYTIKRDERRRVPSTVAMILRKNRLAI